MNNKLVLKDGTEIENGFASRSSRDHLMVRVPGSDVVSSVALFGNPNLTSEIICYYGIHKTTYKNYTHLYSVQYFENENYVETWLTGENTSVEDEIIVPKEYVPEETTIISEKEESENA